MVKLRSEYKEPEYLIEQVNLIFDIHDQSSDNTTVTGTLHYKLHNAMPGTPLVLNGRDLTLLSAKLDGNDILDKIVIAADGDCQLLTIDNVPPIGTLEFKTKINPWTNDSGGGLYDGGGTLVTQCESEYFRMIIPYIDRPDNLAKFTCEIYADAVTFPTLLSNGNLIGSGVTSDGRHFVKYEDPIPKPCYLFALVAGDLAHIKETYVTKSGKCVNLFVHTKADQVGRCEIAMQALRDAMEWDERVYGFEYDLENCHVVGVPKFNAGAMENKGLLIFNDQSLLCDPSISTDPNMLGVISTVVHEYFHNRTGNITTIRTWHELTAKEGYTTQRQQACMSELFGADKIRIEDVATMIGGQFSEDAGPLRKPVRPNELESVKNIYTNTTYVKGAELFSVLERLIGSKNFIEGGKLFSKINAGKAATVENILEAMEIASGRDLKQFIRWFDIAGTPSLEFTDEYDAESQKYTLHVKQSNISVEGVANPPMLMPIAVGLLDSHGRDMIETAILELSNEQQSFTFTDIYERPVPSLLRDFSAPVKITKSPITEAQKIFLFQHDSNVVNRWKMGQELLRKQAFHILDNLDDAAITVSEDIIVALQNIINDPNIDLRMKSELLTLPSVYELIADLETVDLDGLFKASNILYKTIAQRFEADWLRMYYETKTTGQNELTKELISKRALNTCCLYQLMELDKPEYVQLCEEQFNTATNMTNTMVPFSLLTSKQYTGCSEVAQRVLDAFYDKWHTNHLVVVKWFSMQAFSEADDALDRLYKLVEHPAFNIKIPNHIYRVYGGFGGNNLKNFHRKDGAGYKFIEDAIIAVDKFNPEASSYLLPLFEDWRKYDPVRKELMLATLRRLDAADLKGDARSLIAELLADAPPVAELQALELSNDSDFISSITPGFDSTAKKLKVEGDNCETIDLTISEIDSLIESMEKDAGPKLLQ